MLERDSMLFLVSWFFSISRWYLWSKIHIS